MIQGLYVAATGMKAVEDRQSAVANNITNAMTPGYKRQRNVDTGFYQLLFSKGRDPFWSNRVPGPGGGVNLSETFTDHAVGSLTSTGNPLNVAIKGPAFIAVNTPAGEMYTRSGDFTIDSEGQLATSDGYKVLEMGGGGIDAQEGPVQIDANGNVTAGGVAMGRLRLVEFDDPRTLVHEGQNLYRATQPAIESLQPAVQSEIIPESLEASNVQLPAELIQMMMGTRQYEANQRVINAIDETVGRLIDQVGMPG